MDETNKENPLLKLDENSIEKPNFINDHIKEIEINKNNIEKSNLNNKMNLMNSMMNQMEMNNQMDSMMMNNSIIDQMDMNQMNTMMNNQMMMEINQMQMNNQMAPNMMNNQMMMEMNQMHMNNQMAPNMMNNQMMMMMNQINLEDEKKMNCQNNNQISDKEKINDKDNQGGISVIFRQSGAGSRESGASVMVQCLKDEKASDIIQRYRMKSGNNDSTNKFIFNGKNLNPSLTVAEAELTNNANIFVVSTKRVRGSGFSLMFTDLSKNRTKEIGFSKKAPSYREVTKGINIFGICKFKKCNAYKKEVVVKIKKKKFDLIKERDDLLCPECEAIIIPKTVGFYLCKFVFYGKKVENRQEEDFRNEEDEANNKDSLKYFDPELNGEVKITELIFEVLEYL